MHFTCWRVPENCLRVLHAGNAIPPVGPKAVKAEPSWQRVWHLIQKVIEKLLTFFALNVICFQFAEMTNFSLLRWQISVCWDDKFQFVAPLHCTPLICVRMLKAVKPPRLLILDQKSLPRFIIWKNKNKNSLCLLLRPTSTSRLTEGRRRVSESVT